MRGPGGDAVRRAVGAQAESWGARHARPQGGSAAIEYEFELAIPKDLSVKWLDGMTLEWLDFIRNNRIGGGLAHAYDVVMGPIADDNALLTVNRYLQGVYSAGEALERLAFFRANDQVSLHTAGARAKPAHDALLGEFPGK